MQLSYHASHLQLQLSYLAIVQVDVILVSPLTRTMQTATEMFPEGACVVVQRWWWWWMLQQQLRSLHSSHFIALAFLICSCAFHHGRNASCAAGGSVPQRRWGIISGDSCYRRQSDAGTGARWVVHLIQYAMPFVKLKCW